MRVQHLTPAHAPAYCALMLEAYRLHPDAFTSSVDERAGLPLAWWQAPLDDGPDARERVLGAFEGEQLAGVVGLAFETRQKARHKAALFGMYVPQGQRWHGCGRQLRDAVRRLCRQKP